MWTYSPARFVRSLAALLPLRSAGWLWLAWIPLALASAASAQAEEITGTIHVQQPDGLVKASGDGTIVFRVREPGKETYSIESQVQAGAYTVDLPMDCTMQVLATRTTEGAGYPLDGNRWIPRPTDGQYDVIVRIPLDFSLRVYGADGRTELKDITVIRKLSKFARLPLPGPLDKKTHLVFREVPSPVPFSIETPEIYTYYVHAPGHAWTKITPDPFLGGVQTMQLPAGGTLKVKLIQEGPGRGRVFRVRNLDPAPDTHPLVHELKRYGNDIEVQGLPVGRFHISSEDPIRPDNMPVYGDAQIEILAGHTTELNLPLKNEPVFYPVPAGGTVTVPEAWGNVEGLVFQLRRLDPYGNWGRDFEVPGTEFVPVVGMERTYSWRIPEVAPGAYNLSFQHTSYSVYREIYGGGHLKLDFSLPAPRTVEVETIDDRTGERVFPEGLLWSALEPEALRKKIKDTAPFLSERRHLPHREGSEFFTIYGPDAALRLQLQDPRFEPGEFLIEGPGDHRVRWSLRRATGVRIEFQLDGQPIEWTGDVRIQAEGGDGKVTLARTLGKATQFHLSEPGNYTVRYPALRGYAPIPPQTVRVPDGEVVALSVPVVAQ